MVDLELKLAVGNAFVHARSAGVCVWARKKSQGKDEGCNMSATDADRTAGKRMQGETTKGHARRVVGVANVALQYQAGLC